MSIMVWERASDEGWIRTPTDGLVGTSDELVYWRVMVAGETEKSFFHKPEDYCDFSGVSMSEVQDSVVDWYERKTERPRREPDEVKCTSTIVRNGMVSTQ